MNVAKTIVLNQPPADVNRTLFVDEFIDEAKLHLMFKLLKLSRINVNHEHSRYEHLHSWYEFIIPFGRDYQCVLNGAKLTVRPGQVLVVQPGDLHSESYPVGGELLFIQFYIQDIYESNQPDSIISPVTSLESRIVDIAGNTEIDMMFELIMLHSQNNSRSLVALSKLCEVIIWTVISLVPEKNLAPAFLKVLQKDQFASLTESYFQQNIKGKLDIKDFCRSMGMSRRVMETKFSEVFNASPQKMFTRLKIKLAVEMLEAGSSIKETAEKLGFKDQFYFSTVFKRVVGYPPSNVNSR